MTLRLLPSTVALLALLVGTPSAARAESPSVHPPILAPGGGDLLPLDERERRAFHAAHRALITQIQTLEKQLERIEAKVAKTDARPTSTESEAMKREARRLRAQSTALRLRLTQALVEQGVDPMLIPYINAIPKDRAGRVERYAHGLVLLLPGLAPAQRALFQRIVPQIGAAYEALTAQKQRTLLALGQTQMEQAEQRAIGRTFERQLRLIDQRFWMLVDLTLDRDTRVALFKRLPTALKKKSQAVEHLYQLPGLTPSQGARLKAALTEMEQEASPDQAAVKRIGAQLRDLSLDPAARALLAKQLGAARARLAALQAATAKATRAILSEEQYLEFLAIPPRLSTNDRAGNSKRVLEGFKPSPAQAEEIRRLRSEQRERTRAVQKRMAEIRRETADYGPDSPQMMSMEMAMVGARAETAAAARGLLGRVFLEVLAPGEVTRWVMGHWGTVR